MSYTRERFSLFVRERYIDGGMLDRTPIQVAPGTVGAPALSIDDNSIESTYCTDLGVRYTLGEDDGWEIFGNGNNLFDQEPRATAQILGRAGVNEFQAGLYDVLGRRFVVGAQVVLGSRIKRSTAAASAAASDWLDSRFSANR